MKPRILLIGLALLALAAAGMALYSTANGPVGFSDTAAYLSSGRNWARGVGLGFFQPSGDFEALTVHPPLYALYYGVLHFLGLDLIAGGRWLNVFAAAAAVLALGMLFLRHSRAPWLALPAAALLIAFPSVIGAFAALMTDGLFLALWLAGMLALFAYLGDGRSKALWAATLLFGLLPLLRYIGLAFLIAGALILLLWRRGDWRQRLRPAALFAAGGLAPSLLWQLISYLTLEHGVAGRGLDVIEGGFFDALTDFALRVGNILRAWNPFWAAQPLQSPWPFLGGLAALALLVAGLVFCLARGEERELANLGDASLFGAFGLTALVFLGSVAGAYLFTSPTPDLIDRTLLPLYVCLLACAFSALGALAGRWPRLAAGLAALGALGLLWGLARPAYELVAAQHQGRIGYFTDEWRHSALIERVRQIPADQALIASQSSILLYWADRPAHEMIPYLPPGFLDSGDPYGSAPEADRWQALFREGAALVLFERFPEWLLEQHGEGLTEGLRLIGEYPQGAIYEYEP